MIGRIIGSLADVLTGVKNRLIHTETELHKEEGKTINTLSASGLKKRGRPKLQGASITGELNVKQTKSRVALQQTGKYVKQTFNKERGLPFSSKKAQQVDKLTEDKQMTIAEACKKIGLSQSYYYKIRQTK